MPVASGVKLQSGLHSRHCCTTSVPARGYPEEYRRSRPFSLQVVAPCGHEKLQNYLQSTDSGWVTEVPSTAASLAEDLVGSHKVSIALPHHQHQEILASGSLFIPNSWGQIESRITCNVGRRERSFNLALSIPCKTRTGPAKQPGMPPLPRNELPKHWTCPQF